VPTAWGITSDEQEATIDAWLRALVREARAKVPTWLPSCVVVDCCEALINAIRCVPPMLVA